MKEKRIYKLGHVALDPLSKTDIEKEREHDDIRRFLVSTLGFHARHAFDHLLVLHQIEIQIAHKATHHVTLFQKAIAGVDIAALTLENAARHTIFLERAHELDALALEHLKQERNRADQNLLSLFPYHDGLHIHGRYTFLNAPSEIRTHFIGDSHGKNYAVIDLSNHVEFVTAPGIAATGN